MALLFDSWLLELVTLMATLFASFYIYVNKVCFQYWKKRGLPHLEPSFPFGNITNMAMQRSSIAEEIQNIYKSLEGHKIGGMYQFWIPSVILLDPEMVKLFLVKDFSSFHDHGIYVDPVSDPLSGHLFLMEGKKWKHLRNKLSPTFTSGKLKMMFPTLVQCGEELQKYLGDMAERNDTLEMKEVFAKYSTDVVARVAFGIESNTLKNPDSEFRTMGRKAFAPSYKTNIRDILSVMVPSLAAVLKIPSVPRDVTKFFLELVKETIDFREANNVAKNDFMQLLIKIRNRKSVMNDGDREELKKMRMEKQDKEPNYYDLNGMTVPEVAAQAFVFFAAGFETTASAMSFCLHELAVNLEVQEQLRDEVDTVLADNEGAITYDAIMKMTYLDKVFYETLRKYPPVPGVVRKCNEEYRVLGTDVVIEKGTSVFVPVQAIHWDPRYYPDPETFDPERFAEGGKDGRHPYTYLPFGEGPRICIGNRFAMMQAKVAIVLLISKYQFEVCPISTRVPLKMDPKSFVAMPIGGINLKISRRR